MIRTVEILDEGNKRSYIGYVDGVEFFNFGQNRTWATCWENGETLEDAKTMMIDSRWPKRPGYEVPFYKVIYVVDGTYRLTAATYDLEEAKSWLVGKIAPTLTVGYRESKEELPYEF